MKKASADLYQDFFEQIVGRKETQLFKDDEIQHFFIKERILIIGAGGSIGSALARRLISAKLTNIFFWTGMSLPCTDLHWSYQIKQQLSLKIALWEIFEIGRASRM